MTYIIISIVVLIVIIILYKSLSSSGKSGSKLSYRDRAKLEYAVEAVTKSESISETAEIIPPKKYEETPLEIEPKTVQKPHPKKYREEILKYGSHIDVENDKFTFAFKKAINNVKANNFSAALSDLSKAIESNTDDAPSYYCRGLIKCKINNFDNSIMDFTEAIRLQMDEINALYFRGLAKFETKDFHGAVLDLESFNKDVTGFANSYYLLGLCYSNLNQYDEAIQNFSTAVDYKSNYSDAYFGRALAKEKNGDKEGCCDDLKQALNSGHLEAYHYLKQYCSKVNAIMK